MTSSVLVIGGGMAGLLAARRHALAGADVTVLEAAGEIGGAVTAADVAGIEISTGAEAFSVASGSVGRLLQELRDAGALPEAAAVVSPRAGLGSRLVSDAGALPSPRGGLLGIPGRPLSADARRVLGLVGALRAWAERFLPAGFGLSPGVSVDAYVRARMGRRVAERLVAPIVGGVHSADPRTLELASALPRLEEAVREHGSLAAAVRSLRPAGGSGRASAGTSVQSLTPSMAALPGALAAQITALGGTIRTGAEVAHVRRSGSGWEAVLAGSPAPEPLRAEHLVLAVDPGTIRRILRADASEAASAAETGWMGAPRSADALDAPSAGPLAPVLAALPDAPAAPVRLVVLALRAPALDALPSGTGALVAPGTRGIRAKALTHASAKWEHIGAAARTALGPGGHVVRLSYGRPGETLPGDDGLGEAGVVDLALADASRILRTPLTRAELAGSRVITWSGAMRPSRSGHREALARLEDALLSADLPLELLGSWRAGTGLDALARAEEQLAAAPTARTQTPQEGQSS